MKTQDDSYTLDCIESLVERWDKPRFTEGNTPLKGLVGEIREAIQRGRGQDFLSRITGQEKAALNSGGQ